MLDEEGWTDGKLWYPKHHYFEKGKRESICGWALRLESYSLTDEMPKNSCNRCLGILRKRERINQTEGVKTDESTS